MKQVLVIEEDQNTASLENLIKTMTTLGRAIGFKVSEPGNLLAEFKAEVGALEKSSLWEHPHKKPGLLLTFAEDTGIKKGDNVHVLILREEK